MLRFHTTNVAERWEYSPSAATSRIRCPPLEGEETQLDKLRAGSLEPGAYVADSGNDGFGRFLVALGPHDSGAIAGLITFAAVMTHRCLEEGLRVFGKDWWVLKYLIELDSTAELCDRLYGLPDATHDSWALMQYPSADKGKLAKGTVLAELMDTRLSGGKTVFVLRHRKALAKGQVCGRFRREHVL